MIASELLMLKTSNVGAMLTRLTLNVLDTLKSSWLMRSVKVAAGGVSSGDVPASGVHDDAVGLHGALGAATVGCGVGDLDWSSLLGCVSERQEHLRLGGEHGSRLGAELGAF